MDPPPGTGAELRPPYLPSAEPEPVYQDEARPSVDSLPSAPAAPSRRLLPWLICGLVAAAASSIAVVLLVTGRTPSGPGAPTARLAAERFVAAVNAGDKDAAAAISCASFRDRAHGAAVTGADPGITFALGDVRVTGTTATATVTEHLVFAGTTSDTRVWLSVVETSGRWLVCGTA